MNLNSLITGPARLGLSIAGRLVGLVTGRSTRVDDQILQQQVEAEVYDSRRVAKSKVDIEVVDSVVWLRGEVKSKAVSQEIEDRAIAVEGVVRIENLLRVAKSPARPKAKAQKRPAPKRSPRPKPAAATAPPPEAEPAKPAAAPAEPATPPQAEHDVTPPAGSPTLSPAAQEERPVTRRFSSEEPPAEAENSPAERSESGLGREPAPLGATGASGQGGSPPAPFPSVSNGNGGGDDGPSSA